MDRPSRAYLVSTTALSFFYPATWPTGALTFVGNAAPWAWAASDEVCNSIVFYEAA